MPHDAPVGRPSADNGRPPEEPWAVVTGGGSGIGAVVARMAAERGYRVAIWDIDPVSGQLAADQIGPQARADVVDVADELTVLRALDEIPTPQLLVNNAGVVRFGPLRTLSIEDWETVLRVNLTGAFVVGRAVAARMAGAGGGAIVNVSSVNGLAAAPNAGAYTSTKAAVILLGEQMALEFAAEGVRVNVVAPGLIMAGMSDPIYADEQARRVRQSKVPLGRLGLAEDVAEAVLFLASDRASYITGQTIAVDGGLTKAALMGLARPADVDSVGTSPTR